MLKKIAENIWKVKLDGNVYFLNLGKKIIIDTSSKENRYTLAMALKPVVNPSDVDIVILTHFHYDHIGNIDLFSNAKFYASYDEIDAFKKNSYGAVLNQEIEEKLKKIELLAIPKHLESLEVIHTPGHTVGSICLWYKEKKILFSGDTLFDKRIFGRTDLPTSEPDKMMASIIKLAKHAHYEILCPGHDY